MFVVQSFQHVPFSSVMSSVVHYCITSSTFYIIYYFFNDYNYCLSNVCVTAINSYLYVINIMCRMCLKLTDSWVSVATSED